MIGKGLRLIDIDRGIPEHQLNSSISEVLHKHFKGFARLNVIDLPLGFELNTFNFRPTDPQHVDSICRSIVINGVQMNEPSRGLCIAGCLNWITTELAQSIAGLQPSQIPILEFSDEGKKAMISSQGFIGCGGSHRASASVKVHMSAKVSVERYEEALKTAQGGKTKAAKQKAAVMRQRLESAKAIMDSSKYWLVLVYDKGVCILSNFCVFA